VQRSRRRLERTRDSPTIIHSADAAISFRCVHPAVRHRHRGMRTEQAAKKKCGRGGVPGFTVGIANRLQTPPVVAGRVVWRKMIFRVLFYPYQSAPDQTHLCTGGVGSSLGKGLTSARSGMLLERTRPPSPHAKTSIRTSNVGPRPMSPYPKTTARCTSSTRSEGPTSPAALRAFLRPVYFGRDATTTTGADLICR